MVAGCGDHDPLARRFLEQLRICERGSREGRLGRNEHDHHLGAAADAAGVALLRELLDLLAHAAGVRVEQARPFLGALGVERVEVGVERHLRVDRQPAAAREAISSSSERRLVRTR
jgi:hypothetical protein